MCLLRGVGVLLHRKSGLERERAGGGLSLWERVNQKTLAMILSDAYRRNIGVTIGRKSYKRRQSVKRKHSQRRNSVHRNHSFIFFWERVAVDELK